MTWFERKNILITALKVNAADIGVEAERITFGGLAQLLPCINIHLSANAAQGAMLKSGARAAGEMGINIIITVPGSMNDHETQDAAMAIALKVASHKPPGFYDDGVVQVVVLDGNDNNKITDISAISAMMSTLYSYS